MLSFNIGRNWMLEDKVFAKSRLTWLGGILIYNIVNMIFNWFSLKARSKLCNYKTVLLGYTQLDEPILSSSIATKVIIYVFLWVFHGKFSHLKLNHSRWQKHYWYRHLKLNFLTEFCGLMRSPKLILNQYPIIITCRGRWRYL